MRGTPPTTGRRPGGIPVWFDHDSVTQIVGHIADKSA
jgi:hypothetical protein